MTYLRPYRAFDEFYRPFESLFNSRFPSAAEDRWLPPVEVKKDEYGYTLEMELPGFSAEQVNVEAHDDVLTVRGTRESSSESEEEGVVRSERRYGSFSRQFSLPAGTNTDAIAASVKDGLLTLSIPVNAPEEPRSISVN